MKIVLMGLGSMGDVRPCVIFAKELKKRGHKVVLIAYEKYRSLVEDYGIRFFPYSGEEQELMDVVMDERGFGIHTVVGLEKVYQKQIGSVKGKLYQLCKRADMLLYATHSSSVLCWFGEALHKPYMRISFWPDEPTKEVTAFGWIDSPFGSFMQGTYNKVSHQMSNYFSTAITRIAYRKLQKELKLPNSFRYGLRQLDGKPIQNLYAYSEQLIPRYHDYEEHIHITGYWFDDEENNSSYEPEIELKEFLQAGEPPIYLGFGSMAGEDKEILLKILEVLTEEGKRVLLSKGKFTIEKDELPDQVYILGYVPHEWLFHQVSAVIHHGGAGTTSTGLRAGKPTLIIPFGSDQVFWGKMIHKRGLGPEPILRQEFTKERFRKALGELLTQEVCQRAGGVGENLRKEDGIKNACICVEKLEKFYKGHM